MRRTNVRILIFATVVCLAGLLVAGASALGIKEVSPPTGTVGVPYSFTFVMKDGSGTPPLKWELDSGEYPPGLSLTTSEDTKSATLSGTPTQAGSFKFYLEVHNSPLFPSSTQRDFTVNIAPGEAAKPRLIITTTTLVDANINQAYTAPALAASGGAVSSWAIASGSLPTGLALNPATGVISGTPTQSGTFTFVVQANSATATSDTHQLSLFVLAPLGLQTLVNRTPPESGLTAKKLVGATLKTGVKAVGGKPPYTFTSTGTIPPGMTLDSATGAITGAGTAAGRYPFTVTVTDGAGTKVSVEWNITILPLLDFTKGKGLPAGKVDRVYSARIPVRGKDSKTAQFAVAGEIPPGLEVDDTGRLTGTLVQAGTYRLRVFAFPENGAPISKVFRVRVRA